jgi:hypothetical protein
MVILLRTFNHRRVKWEDKEKGPKWQRGVVQAATADDDDHVDLLIIAEDGRGRLVDFRQVTFLDAKPKQPWSPWDASTGMTMGAKPLLVSLVRGDDERLAEIRGLALNELLGYVADRDFSVGDVFVVREGPDRDPLVRPVEVKISDIRVSR